ncbi:MAG: hypothetical protein D4R88_04155 [Methanosarcinales archaeon]|nr:MAG: hypothetical protein D4R88_04155 [Methanosarcinales archaeon]
MEFNEINVPEGIIQQIDHAGPFACITVDGRNRDHIYSNVNLDVSYEDTLGDMGNMVDEMNMERTRYLLSTDEMLEEMLGQTQA